MLVLSRLILREESGKGGTKLGKAKVFIFAPADENGESHLILKKLGCDLVLGEASWFTPQGNNEEQMCHMGKDADGMIGTSIRSSPITRKVMQSSETLRIISKYSIGVDDVDVEAATEMGILVTHSPVESNWGGVAETTIAMMLNILKKLGEKAASMRNGNWRKEELAHTYIGRRESDGYEGIVVGIIGLGRVGGRVADLLRPWGVRILAYDPYILDEQFTEHNAESVSLEQLLKLSDVVSLHVILTRETRKLIGAKQIELMKPSSILINTSRGPVIDETTLVTALEENMIGGAALDVFEEEPLSVNSKLRQMGDKVLLSPHMSASLSGNSGFGLGIELATESLIKALQGQIPDHVFNPEAVDRWKHRFLGRPII